MIKIKIFQSALEKTHALEDEVNRFCQQVVTKGSVYGKVFSVDCHLSDESEKLFAVVTYDDGESERTAT